MAAVRMISSALGRLVGSSAIIACETGVAQVQVQMQVKNSRHTAASKVPEPGHSTNELFLCEHRKNIHVTHACSADVGHFSGEKQHIESAYGTARIC